MNVLFLQHVQLLYHFFQNPALDRESNPHLIFSPLKLQMGPIYIQEYTVISTSVERYSNQDIEVNAVTRNRMDSPGIESQWGRDPP
jgi:hypothetical protein